MTHPEYPDETAIREWVAHIIEQYGEDTDVGDVIEYDTSYDAIDAYSVAGIVRAAAGGPDGIEGDALIQWDSGWEPAFEVEHDWEGTIDGFRYSLVPPRKSDESDWPPQVGGITGVHLDWVDVAHGRTDAAGLELVVGILNAAVMELRNLHEFAKRITVLPA